MPVVLPNLAWVASPNVESRAGHVVSLVVVHRWGASSIPVSEGEEKVSYGGVINWFSQSASQVSAHVVFPGSAAPGEATQMVSWDDFAWAEEAYNPAADEVESADDIWIGNDPTGMADLAKIVAQRLTVRHLPPVWSTRTGFCRHADLGIAGGDHLDCPTTNLEVWRHFITLVQAEYKLVGVPKVWGR